jgi:hypothetical protein
MSFFLNVAAIVCGLVIGIIGLRSTRRDTSPAAKLRRKLDANPVQRSLMDSSPELAGYRVRAIEDSAKASRTANRWMAALGLTSVVLVLAALVFDHMG